MAFVFGTQASVYIDGKSADCALSEINLEAELDEAEVTTLCSTIKDYIPGLAEVTVEVEGFFDTNTLDPASTLEAWLEARMGTIFPFVFAPAGDSVLGDPAYFMNGFLQEFSVSNTVDEAAAVEATFRCTSALSRGKMVQPLATFTATGNGPDLDNLVLTSAGGSAVLSVSAVSGTTPTLDVVLEHSVDGVTWATLGTFSQQNAVNGEIITFSGTVNRHVRAVHTIGGTSPSFTMNVVLHRN